MTRHPPTEGNDLKPKRVDAQEDVTVPDGNDGRFSINEVKLEIEKTAEAKAIIASEGVFPQLWG